MYRYQKALGSVIKSLFVMCLCSVVLEAAAPKGWFVAGSKPTEYESGVDVSAVHNFHPSAYLRTKAPLVQGFGTLMQDLGATRYRGRRVRFSAFVKTRDAQNWAGLWMRVDNGPEMLAFDNMQDRPIVGTNDWRRYSVVLDIPRQATGIFFGVLLNGSGEVWLNDTKIEIVGPDVLPTEAHADEMTDEPVNLDFRE